MTRTLTSAHIEILTTTPLSVPWGDFAALMMRLPRFVREARRLRDVSVYNAAAQIGIAPSTLRKFENGKHVVSFDTALNIMQWMDRDVRGQVAS
jgi:DNA-binding XRE family transcriptional regulator